MTLFGTPFLTQSRVKVGLKAGNGKTAQKGVQKGSFWGSKRGHFDPFLGPRPKGSEFRLGFNLKLATANP